MSLLLCSSCNKQFETKYRLERHYKTRRHQRNENYKNSLDEVGDNSEMEIDDGTSECTIVSVSPPAPLHEGFHSSIPASMSDDEVRAYSCRREEGGENHVGTYDTTLKRK